MQPGTIAIVLVAAVAHAVWNMASKYKRGDTFLFVWAYTCASAALCVPIGIVLVATGAQPLSWQFAVGSLVSAALHLAYSLTLQAGYDRADLSVVYPVARGTGPVLTMLFAILLLGERLTALAMLGSLVIVAGIVVVAGNPFKGIQRNPLQGVLWGAATGAAIAGYTLWDSYSIVSLHLAPVSYYAGTLLLQTLLLTPGAVRRRDLISATVRTDAAPVLTVAVLSPLAYILVLTAMQTAPVALVAPLRESSIVIGSLLAWRLFHENHLVRRITGAGIVLAGIAAVSL
ncbi:DMT family transporter [Amycolatopsis acidiphila]|uniref:EamA family transporter n=1 Tax=Amycolatopsis acidiphila TaxID=715473 RepID=A0A558ANV2_9PSEU|nr:DMT family transporter [Amycolatopsis acidiphila]TVT25942.1 EamA family transporter [Amycolatopsis acidiphila]UIJ63349.1 DMT family transporter [Amycolatopsis acidiphila]GHG75134.1 membrane protein [Amycolatopsis acidiphila]